MNSISITGKMHPGFDKILTEEAQDFILKLHQKFSGTRKSLLEKRTGIHSKILSGEMPGFLKETESVRNGDWQADPVPEDLQDRRCEITGPAEAKMMINALNSGATIFYGGSGGLDYTKLDQPDTGTAKLNRCIRTHTRIYKP